MKAQKSIFLAILLSSFSSLAMEKELSHEELAIKQNALAAKFITETVKRNSLDSLAKQNIDPSNFSKFNGIFDIFETDIAKLLLEEHMLLSDEHLRDLISVYSSQQYIDLENELVSIIDLVFSYYEELEIKKDELQMLDLPSDSLSQRILVYEPIILQASIEASEEINPVVLRHCFFLFDKNIREKFPKGVDSHNFLVTIKNEELDKRTGEIIKQNMPALQKAMYGQAMKILFDHWGSKSSRNADTCEEEESRS